MFILLKKFIFFLIKFYNLQEYSEFYCLSPKLWKYNEFYNTKHSTFSVSDNNFYLII